jgi:acyl carrier protein
MSLTRDELVTFLENDLGLEIGDLEGSTPLFSSGVIDSFMLVTLMGFVEKRGGFRIAPSDVTLANLDTIDRILGFSQRMAK